MKSSLLKPSRWSSSCSTVDTSLASALVLTFAAFTFSTPTIGRLVAPSSAQVYERARKDSALCSKRTKTSRSPGVSNSEKRAETCIAWPFLQLAMTSSDRRGIDWLLFAAVMAPYTSLWRGLP